MEDPRPSELFFVVQKEVADAYLATPPKATYLSNFTGIYAKVKRVLEIPRTDFYPVPKVDATFIRFQLQTPAMNHVQYISFLKNIFRHPRKTVRNNLKLDHTGPLLDKRPAELTAGDLQKLFLLYNPTRS